MEYFFMALSAAAIIALLCWFKKVYFSSGKGEGVLKKKSSGGVGGSGSSVFANCPVCGTSLGPSQNIFSKVFGKAGERESQMCYVYGCPTCYPVAKPGVRRICPCCHKEVSQEGYLISRLFTKTKSGKPHVIINGCGSCHRKS